MGCGFTTAKYYKDGTSYAIRTRMEQRSSDIADFHDTFILDQKIVQSVFGQINLAHKVALTSLQPSLAIGAEPTASKSSGLAVISEPSSATASGYSGLIAKASTGASDLSGSGSASTKKLKRGDSMRLEVIGQTAVKIVDVRMKGAKMLKVLQNEINFWQHLKHEDHVMELRQTFHSADLCYMVMESCIGSLLFYMQRVPDLNERTLGDCFSQMLMGIGYLHSNHVIHRAVKPDSFLVGFEDGKKSIKLCDFTLAVKLSPGQDKLKGEAGSPLFMCPEMVSHQGYDTKADVWSFGVIVYALLFGRFPFEHQEKDSKDVRDAIAMAGRISFKTKTKVPLSSSCIAFSMALLQQDPRNRPTSSEALEKTYMVDILADEHMRRKSLPDLKPMLNKVKKFRSFEYHEPDEKSVIDDVLNRHQLTKHGIPLPKMKDTSIVIGGVSGAKAFESVRHFEKRGSASGSLNMGTFKRSSLSSDRPNDGQPRRAKSSMRSMEDDDEDDDSGHSSISV